MNIYIKKISSFILLLSSIMLLSSCSKDENVNPLDSFANVPNGNIVDLEQRQGVLTGSDDESSNESAQKWWKHKQSVISFSGNCGGEEDQEISLEDTYLAFYPSGEIYSRKGISGSPVNTPYSWSWVDESTKDKINFQGVEFTFTILENSRLIIASNQSEFSCTATTWEEFIIE